MSDEIDLSQFHSIFFEECTEGLEVMESGLLNLDLGEPDNEQLNNIFRAAHSIKGGAGTFGFMEISSFTHAMETVLDELRAGKMPLTRLAVDILLNSVDCLRQLVYQSKENKPLDQDNMNDLIQSLHDLQTDQCTATVSEEAPVTADKAKLDAVWKISFYPFENLFFTGNDPVRLLRELRDMGEVTVRADVKNVPDFKDINPENCYLGWEIMIRTPVSLDALKEVFAWVEDDCKLEFELQTDRREESDRRASEPTEETRERRIDENRGRRSSDRATAAVESTSIRVGIEKADALVNLVGELVITQSIISRECESLGMNMTDKLNASLEQLKRNTRDLQEQTLNIRMLPIDFAFQRLPRLVHDLSGSLGKKAELFIEGRETELDKTILEKISDPLIHLVRNALDHGIESPEERLKAGKSETGRIDVNASHEGGKIIIRIADDGAGLPGDKIYRKALEKGLVNPNDELTDSQIQNLIFLAGFSTALEVNDVSGRGVGMDVVKSNITNLGGSVDVSSEPGKGTEFTLRLPLTLAILDGQMIRVGRHVYIIPIISIVESIQMRKNYLSRVAGKTDVYRYREQQIPVIHLDRIFSIDSEAGKNSNDLLVVLDIGENRIGLRVDEVLDQQQIVIKSLEKNFQNIPGLAGATILGDGSVSLILDLSGLVEQYLHYSQRNSQTGMKIPA